MILIGTVASSEILLLTSDSKLSARDNLAPYQPTFTDQLTFSDSVKSACNNVLSCMIDATLTGNTQIGSSSSNSIQTQQKAIEISSKLLF